jgi:hypothetical protein
VRTCRDSLKTEKKKPMSSIERNKINNQTKNEYRKMIKNEDMEYMIKQGIE